MTSLNELYWTQTGPNAQQKTRWAQRFPLRDRRGELRLALTSMRAEYTPHFIGANGIFARSRRDEID